MVIRLFLPFILTYSIENKEPHKKKMLTFCTRLRNCPSESDFVFGDPDWTGQYEKEQYAGRDERRNTPGADWMVDEVHTKYVD